MPAAATLKSPATRPSSAPAVSNWLFACAACVLLMIVVGGVTRLTRSGLSMVEWKPITGILPPLIEAAWLDALSAYQSSPEGRLVNVGMKLADFRQIYWVEWVHRFLARLTGLVVVVPLLVSALRGSLRGRRALRLALVLGLGALQAVVGWPMVKSGLQDVPHVSHYRLTLHLSLALLVFALLLWFALAERAPWSLRAPRFCVPAPVAWSFMSCFRFCWAD